MFTKTAGKITHNLIRRSVIAEADFELYNFGFEMGLSILANIATTLFIGLLFRMPLESLLFLAAFIPLRSYVGGFHASNYTRCYWLSTLVVVVVLVAVRLVSLAYHAAVFLCAGAFFAAVMFLLVPVPDPNRPLEDIEVRVYRRRGRLILCAEYAVYTVLAVLGLKTAVTVLLSTFCMTCATACIGSVRNRTS